MTHPIIKDLLWRHATKAYDPNKKISTENLDILYEAIRLSPSSINSQPWKFVVISSDEAKQRMSETFANKHQFNQPHIIKSCQTILFAHNPQYNKNDYDKIINKAIIDERLKPENHGTAFKSFMFAELNTDEKGDTGNWCKNQIYLALGNTLHTLARLQIDSTPLEGIDTELVNKEFKKELAGFKCELALCIGYHHQQQDFNAVLPKSRHNLSDILVHI
ncbi:MAG: NAD(P)H-dependent oxidoreductase [Gammaproteobacteria bacterium]|nr:MAG: NAD(P)H-dependent oxidoreductase [Gammaproteobacteria bacterium]